MQLTNLTAGNGASYLPLLTLDEESGTVYVARSDNVILSFSGDWPPVSMHFRAAMA